MSAVNVLITLPQSIEHIKSSLSETDGVSLTPADPHLDNSFSENKHPNYSDTLCPSHCIFCEAPSSLQRNSLTHPAGVTVVFREVQQTTFSKLLLFLCFSALPEQTHNLSVALQDTPFENIHHFKLFIYFACNLYIP